MMGLGSFGNFISPINNAIFNQVRPQGQFSGGGGGPNMTTVPYSNSPPPPSSNSSPYPQDPSQPGYFSGFSPVPQFMGGSGFGGYSPPQGYSPAVQQQGFGIPSFGYGMPGARNPYQNPYGGFQNYPQRFGGPSSFNLPMPYGRGGFNPGGGARPGQIGSRYGGINPQRPTGPTAPGGGRVATPQPYSPSPGRSPTPGNNFGSDFWAPQTPGPSFISGQSPSPQAASPASPSTPYPFMQNYQRPNQYGPMGPGFSSYLPSFMQNYAQPMMRSGGFGGAFGGGGYGGYGGQAGGFRPPFGGGGFNPSQFGGMFGNR